MTHNEAAAVLLKWMDDLSDPYSLALAIGQAHEAAQKVANIGAGREAAKAAFARRFVESIALDNAKLLRSLTTRAVEAKGKTDE